MQHPQVQQVTGAPTHSPGVSAGNVLLNWIEAPQTVAERDKGNDLINRGPKYERLKAMRQGPTDSPGGRGRATLNPETSGQDGEEESGAAPERVVLTDADLARLPAPPPEELLADREVVDFLLYNKLPEYKELSVAHRKDKRRNIKDKAAFFDVQGGRLFRFRQVKRKLNEEGNQAVLKLLVLSAAQRDQVLKEVHTEGGHPGYTLTKNRIMDRFWWKTSAEDIKNYVRDCEHCKEAASLKEKQDKRLALRAAAEVRIAPKVNTLDLLMRGELAQQRTAVWLDCDPGESFSWLACGVDLRAAGVLDLFTVPTALICSLYFERNLSFNEAELVQSRA